MKNIRIVYPKNFHYLMVKFSVYSNRRVFVMDEDELPTHEQKTATVEAPWNGQ